MDIIVLLLRETAGWRSSTLFFFLLAKKGVSYLVSVLKETASETLDVSDPDSDVTRQKKGLTSRAVTPQGERGLL